MPFRISEYARKRMRRRRIPEVVVRQVYEDPDDRTENDPAHGPDRELRWRQYDDQVVEIVVDLTDGSVVSVWVTQVN